MSEDAAVYQVNTSRRSHRGVFWLLLLLTLVSGVLLALSILEGRRANEQLMQKSRVAAINAVTENVRLIENRIAGLTVAAEIAADIEAGTLRADGLDQRFDESLKSKEGVSITVGWLPEFRPEIFESFSEKVIYFKSAAQLSQGRSKIKDGYSQSQVDNKESGDITSWYREAMLGRKALWISSPYRSPVSSTWWACGYSVPFFNGEDVAGVVAAELTLEQAGRLIFSAENQAFEGLPLEASFGMLVAADGTIFSHPDQRVVQQGTAISSFFPSVEQPAAVAELFPLAAEVTTAGKTLRVYELQGFQDQHTGQLLSVFFAPIEGTGWWTAVVLDKLAIDRSMGHPERIKASTYRIVISAMICAFFLILLMCRVDRGLQGYLWPASILITLLCVIVIAWVLTHSFTHTAYFHPGEVVLKNTAIPAKALMKYEAGAGVDTVHIPTGIFVQSAEFSNANDVTITGFVWQHYNDDLPDWLKRDPDDISPGFIFPESEQTSVEFRYRRPNEQGCTLGWYFTAVLRQEFDYGQYPFDQENVWVRMWHSKMGRDVALVPDLGAYTTLVPNQYPGLELQDFVLEGWDIAGTYFSYRPNSYNTDFGIDGYSGSQAFPELYFNITLTRSFLNAFIMNFITLTVAAFLLYAVLHTVRRRKQEQGLLGFNVAGVLGFCAALFFVVILAHTSLRETLSSPRLVYLEYYFFVMYAAFLGVSVNAIVVASEQPHTLVRLEDNLIARLLFWPLLGIALLLATLLIFY